MAECVWSAADCVQGTRPVCVCVCVCVWTFNLYSSKRSGPSAVALSTWLRGVQFGVKWFCQLLNSHIYTEHPCAALYHRSSLEFSVFTEDTSQVLNSTCVSCSWGERGASGASDRPLQDARHVHVVCLSHSWRTVTSLIHASTLVWLVMTVCAGTVVC